MNPTMYRKGFTDTSVLEAFRQAVLDGDVREIALAVKASGSERLPVDAVINGLPRAMRANQLVVNDNGIDAPPEFGSAEYEEGMRMVAAVAEMRDLPFDKLDSTLPRGMREVSPFLQTERVHDYLKGKDYGTGKADFKAIQSGKMMGKPDLNSDKMVEINTPRQAGAYVHTDNPLEPWTRFIKHLLDHGITPKQCAALEDVELDTHGKFTVYGMPFFLGMLGQSLMQAGWCSFYVKWRDFAPRPEESAPIILGERLPLGYPEGSPMHCSDHSMHSVATCTCKHLTLSFFDGNLAMPGDEFEGTIQDNAELLADNVGYWRIFPGVHFPWEHTRADQRAAKYVNSVVSNYLA